jgi:hypothetical protein
LVCEVGANYELCRTTEGLHSLLAWSARFLSKPKKRRATLFVKGLDSLVWGGGMQTLLLAVLVKRKMILYVKVMDAINVSSTKYADASRKKQI